MAEHLQKKKKIPNGKRCRNIRSNADRQIGKAKKETIAAERRLELARIQLRGEQAKCRRLELALEEAKTAIELMADGLGVCDICENERHFVAVCEETDCGNCKHVNCPCYACQSGSHMKLDKRYKGESE